MPVTVCAKCRGDLFKRNASGFWCCVTCGSSYGLADGPYAYAAPSPAGTERETIIEECAKVLSLQPGRSFFETDRDGEMYEQGFEDAIKALRALTTPNPK